MNGVDSSGVPGEHLPALPLSLLPSRWKQAAAVLPPRPPATHLWGCHRPRLADRFVFEHLLQVRVPGCSIVRIADNR